MKIAEQAASRIKEGNTVVFTGSGVSAESGIPTFRGKDGLWEKYDPARYVTMPQVLYNLLEDPQDIAGFIIEFYALLNAARPNSAHEVIADLEKKRLVTGVITQNIDNLHQAAGSGNVCELHGNAFEISCIKCGFKKKRSMDDIKGFVNGFQGLNKRWDLLKYIFRYMGKCPRCNTRLRPNVVLFGEMLPSSEIEKSTELIEDCSCLVIVGASGIVYPASSIPFEAKRKGAFLIEVNIEPAYASIADLVIQSPAASAFEEISRYL